MRLDQALHQRELVPSRAIAQRQIADGFVRVNGEVATRAAQPVEDSDALEVVAQPRFVSRGGDKLDAALDAWNFNVSGLTCLDVGAGTGGFTDCLLQRGAAKVFAFDVGHEQLHESLRHDARIVRRDGINCRELSRDDIGEAVHLAVVDVSFISLGLILPAVAQVVEPNGNIIALVKPQFESGREAAERGRGLIKDPQLHRDALDKTRATANALGLEWRGALESPLKGGGGNREYLAWMRRAE